MKCIWCLGEEVGDARKLGRRCMECSGLVFEYRDGSSMYVKDGYADRGNWLEDENVVEVPAGCLFIVGEVAG